MGTHFTVPGGLGTDHNAYFSSKEVHFTKGNYLLKKLKSWDGHKNNANTGQKEITSELLLSELL